MIKILQKKDCCGCGSCVQKCPKQCILLTEDNEGFLYPKIDESSCIDCGLCEKVCPILYKREEKKPLNVYAAKNINEEIRRQSSSGGVFTLLAEKVIFEGGFVFGARFDEKWEVKHDCTDTIEGLAPFRGSKYVQSRIEDNYKKAEELLKQGRKVLFSGTPCQIAGLKSFLRKEYENLLTVDFVCHGVPSPGVWRQYLKNIVTQMCENNMGTDDLSLKRETCVKNISFRDKRSGWKKYSFVLTLSETFKSGKIKTISLCEVYLKNTFMKGFLADLYLRPSCYACIAKCGKSESDITIGDFWGIQRYYPDFDDDKGVSLVLCNTIKGNRYLNGIEVEIIKTTYARGLRGNPSLEHSVLKTKHVDEFWKMNSINHIEKICRRKAPSFAKKVINRIAYILHLK